MASDCEKITIHILSILFGTGSWIAVNGLWVELPLLVEKLPEGWTLSSYIAVIIQVANLGPLLYGVLLKKFGKRRLEKLFVHVLMAVGSVSCIFLAYFWKKTTYIGDSEHSTILLILVFFLSLVDCTSSVLFLPFMANFPKEHLMPYLIGEGLSGFLPSVVALIQGVGGNPICVNASDPANSTDYVIKPFLPPPRFPVRDFFFFLFSMMFLSWMAFLFLTYMLRRRKQKMFEQNSISSSSGTSGSLPSQRALLTVDAMLAEGDCLTDSENTSSADRSDSVVVLQADEDVPEASTTSQPFYIYLLLLQLWISFLSNGLFPGLQPYSCLPYGNTVYHYAITLSTMANPVACFVASFIPGKSLSWLTSLGILSHSIACYALATAVLSPEPPFVHQILGQFLVTAAWISMVGIFSYIKASVASVLRDKGHQALFWYGAMTQIGSAAGALITFIFIAKTNLFTSYEPCSDVDR